MAEPAPQIRFLSLEQIEGQLKALASERAPLREMVATLTYAGLRREELLWLTKDDVDLDARVIRVQAKTVGRPCANARCVPHRRPLSSPAEAGQRRRRSPAEPPLVCLEAESYEESIGLAMSASLVESTWTGYSGATVSFTGKTFYIWAHPKKDEQPPAAVTDLKVALDGDRATVAFTAPADDGGGKVVRYQVKCSAKPLVDYATFLRKFAANEDAAVTNYWMAANLSGEPAPQAAGAKESFVVTGVPAGARYFAICSFDDSSNRSALSNVAEAGK